MYTPTQYSETTRHFMWKRLFQGRSPSKEERLAYANESGKKQAYDVNEQIEEDYEKAREKLNMQTLTVGTTFIPTNEFTLNIPSIGAEQVVNYTMCSPVQYETLTTAHTIKETNMCYECGTEEKFDLLQVQYSRLTERLRSIYYSKQTDLKKTFNIDPVPAPTTIEDFVSRITAGKFSFNTTKFEKQRLYGYGLFHYITWDDPAVKPDYVGYETAGNKLEDAYTTAMDQITFTPTMDVLTNFQSSTFN